MMALAVVTSFASSADSPAAKLRPQTEQTSDCYDFPQKNFHRDNCVKAKYGASPAIPMGEGEAAIDFTLHDLAGTPHTLSHMLESKPVLLVWGMWTCPAYQVAPRSLNHASSQPGGTTDPSALCATARAVPVNYPAPWPARRYRSSAAWSATSPSVIGARVGTSPPREQLERINPNSRRDFGSTSRTDESHPPQLGNSQQRGVWIVF